MLLRLLVFANLVGEQWYLFFFFFLNSGILRVLNLHVYIIRSEAVFLHMFKRIGISSDYFVEGC